MKLVGYLSGYRVIWAINLSWSVKGEPKFYLKIRYLPLDASLLFFTSPVSIVTTIIFFIPWVYHYEVYCGVHTHHYLMQGDVFMPLEP